MSEVTQEMIKHLQTLISEGKDKLQQAAQYAGEHNIPLKYIDESYDEDEEDIEDYYDGPKLRFGGQEFDLDGYNGKYRWYNSNC